jgi:rubrerythrin
MNFSYMLTSFQDQGETTMNGRFEISASGMTRDHLEAQERYANAMLERAGLIVFECCGCREVVEAPESNPVCPECGRRAILSADGYAD